MGKLENCSFFKEQRSFGSAFLLCPGLGAEKGGGLKMLQLLSGGLVTLTFDRWQ